MIVHAVVVVAVSVRQAVAAGSVAQSVCCCVWQVQLQQGQVDALLHPLVVVVPACRTRVRVCVDVDAAFKGVRSCTQTTGEVATSRLTSH